MSRKMSPHAALVQALHQGSASFPTLLFTEYARLGLNEGQLMLLMHLQVFREKEGTPFPTVKQLEKRMSVSGDQVVKWLQSLVKGGFLTIEQSINEHGICYEQYSVEPLLQQLAASALDKEKEGAHKAVKDQLFSLFEQEFGRPLSPMECEYFTQWVEVDQQSKELIVAALREAVFVEKLGIRYIDRILLEWKRNQVKTPEEAVEFSRKFRQQQGILYQGQEKASESKGEAEEFSFYNWVKHSG